MTESDLECLKSHIDKHVEIVTRSGDRLRIKVISVFDEESDPDVFFWNVTGDSAMPDPERTEGEALPLAEIVSVKPA